LLLNFGSQTQAPIPPPNTVVLQRPDSGGGSLNTSIVAGVSIASSNSPNDGSAPAQPIYLNIGTLGGWTELMMASPSTSSAPGSTGQTQTIVSVVTGTDPNVGNGAPPVMQQNTSMGTGMISNVSSSPAPAPPAVIAAGPAPAVVKAVDEALGQLVSDD
jgi:hypothetical protein